MLGLRPIEWLERFHGNECMIEWGDVHNEVEGNPERRKKVPVTNSVTVKE